MRDLLILLGYTGAVPFILMRPAVGVLTWALLGLWNIHRLSYGIARSFPIAMMIGAVTLVSFVMHSEDRRPLPWYPPLVVLTILIVHMQITTVFAYDYAYTLPLYSKVMKILLMTYIAIWVLHTKKDLLWLVGIMTFSMGFYGLKGGVFTVLSGGQSMVKGPQGTFIDGNTTMAMALLMTVPYMVFFLGFIPKINWKHKLFRLGLLGVIALTSFAIVGSYSRGAFLSGGAMAGFLWLKSKKKAVSMVALVMFIPLVLAFMPDKFTNRMSGIENAADEDQSAQGRIHAWIYAWNLAKDYPLTGAGFDGFHRGLWLIYAPPEGRKKFVDAHSNWFQMLGHHGWPGLILFLALGVANWFSCTWIIRRTKGVPELDWVNRLAAMTQVSLIAYVVAGSFLGASYFDFYYYQIVLILGMRRIVEEHLSGVNVQALSGQKNTDDPPVNNEQPIPAGAAARVPTSSVGNAGRRLMPGMMAVGHERKQPDMMSAPIAESGADELAPASDRVSGSNGNTLRPDSMSAPPASESSGSGNRFFSARKKAPASKQVKGNNETDKLSMLPGHRPVSSWVGQKR